MSCRIVILFLLRIIILLFSVGTLACHVAQLVLLGQQDGTGDWWPNYIPYILYYVGPIVSILSVIILLFLACFQAKSLIGDRIMSIINLFLCIAVVVYNSLQAGMIPWQGAVSNSFTSNEKGWATYCSNYGGTGLVSVRCWLQNGTWLGMIVVGFFWLLMALYTVVQRNSDIYNEDYDPYDYKDDVPMATTTTRKTSSIQHLASPPPNQQPYMSPTTPHHHSFVGVNNTGSPIITDNTNYYYQQQQHQLYDNNNDYYLNPVQEEHLNNNSHHSMVYHDAVMDPAAGYERSRKVSKTFLEEEFNRNNSGSTVQPPHSYDGGYKPN